MNEKEKLFLSIFTSKARVKKRIKNGVISVNYLPLWAALLSTAEKGF